VKRIHTKNQEGDHQNHTENSHVRISKLGWQFYHRYLPEKAENPNVEENESNFIHLVMDDFSLLVEFEDERVVDVEGSENLDRSACCHHQEDQASC
jgi:hypothetical protein